MASEIGRKLVVKRDGTTVAGVRTKSVTINNEAVDITTDDDTGYRTLLEESGQKQIDMSVEGLTKDDTLIEKATSGTSLIENYTIELPSGATITGSFRFNNLEVGAEYNEAITFTSEFQSTGSFTFNAAP
jgi:TP901-1 family phage major tail protein